MHDFAKQLKIAEQLAKEHGSLVIPGAASGSEPASKLKIIEYPKAQQGAFMVLGKQVVQYSSLADHLPKCGEMKIEKVMLGNSNRDSRLHQWLVDREHFGTVFAWKHRHRFDEIHAEFLAAVVPYFRIDR